jgi:hypothetical protein
MILLKRVRVVQVAQDQRRRSRRLNASGSSSWGLWAACSKTTMRAPMYSETTRHTAARSRPASSRPTTWGLQRPSASTFGKGADARKVELDRRVSRTALPSRGFGRRPLLLAEGLGPGGEPLFVHRTRSSPLGYELPDAQLSGAFVDRLQRRCSCVGVRIAARKVERWRLDRDDREDALRAEPCCKKGDHRSVRLTDEVRGSEFVEQGGDVVHVGRPPIRLP